MKSIAWYVVAALGEIAGCFGFWAWMRLGKSPFWTLPAIASLILFALALTRIDSVAAGRAYAAYGGIYIVSSLAWMWIVEGARPDGWDLLGAAICLAGGVVILFGPGSTSWTACYSRDWMTRKTIFLLAATALLLLTGAELFACEMIAPERCESFGFPNSTSGGPPDDNCICCCTHAVVVSPVALAPVGEGVRDVMATEPSKPAYKTFSIYHPPRV